jgi:hypothetical protein
MTDLVNVAAPAFPLPVVDAFDLPAEFRRALRPGETVLDRKGRSRVLPRYFYEVPSWDTALDLHLAPHFALWEFLQVDVREAEPLRRFPRYVPCALPLLAVCLERFREAVGTFVHISANGGYRSPTHAFSSDASLHSWGTAVNIYRIGDTYLDNEKAVERYRKIAHETLPGVWTRPFGQSPGAVEDHLHLDLGYVVVTPRDVSERDTAQ